MTYQCLRCKETITEGSRNRVMLRKNGKLVKRENMQFFCPACSQAAVDNFFAGDKLLWPKPGWRQRRKNLLAASNSDH